MMKKVEKKTYNNLLFFWGIDEVGEKVERLLKRKVIVENFRL